MYEIVRIFTEVYHNISGTYKETIDNIDENKNRMLPKCDHGSYSSR